MKTDVPTTVTAEPEHRTMYRKTLTRHQIVDSTAASGGLDYWLKSITFSVLLILAGSAAASESGLPEPLSGASQETEAGSSKTQASDQPTLGNTAPEDDKMSIEVADQFVWKPAKATDVGSVSPGKATDVWSKIIAANRMPVHIKPAIELSLIHI